SAGGWAYRLPTIRGTVAGCGALVTGSAKGSVKVSSAKEVELGRDHELPRGPVALRLQAAHDDDRQPVGLPAPHEVGGGRELVGERHPRRPQLRPAAIGGAAEVDERRDPGDADRDV